MSAEKRRRLHGEAGTSLVIAMAFLALLGSGVVVMLTASFASVKSTESTRGQQDRVFGADGGLDYGIQAVRTNSSYCADSSTGTQTLPSQTIDGKTVTVTCQTLSGSAGGTGGSYSQYSLIITGYNNPDGTTPNLDGAINIDGKTHSDNVLFDGPVFNAGGFTFASSSPLVHMTSTLQEYNDAPNLYCATEQAQNITQNNMQVDGAWTCPLKTTTNVPDPAPTVVVPTATAPSPVLYNFSCNIYFPGVYTSAPTFDFNSNYYFASGVYYFANAGEMALAGQVTGGMPDPTESHQMTNMTPCANDTIANSYHPGAASGYGVEFVLGGTSKLRVGDSQKDRIELYQRIPANAASEGTAGISIYAPRTNGTNYVKWNSDKVLNMDGNKSTMIIHGMFYAPTGFVNKAYALQNPGNVPTFAGGLLAQRLTLFFDNQSTTGATASIAGIILPAPGSPRTVVVTATSTGTGEGPVTEQAVITLGASSTTPPTIQSWRKV